MYRFIYKFASSILGKDFQIANSAEQTYALHVLQIILQAFIIPIVNLWPFPHFMIEVINIKYSLKSLIFLCSKILT